MPGVLIVDDSRSINALLIQRIESTLGFECVVCETHQETRQALGSRKDLVGALVDLGLPDAPNGEALDSVLAAGIPAVVLTGDVSPETRDRIWSRNVVDYVYKDSFADLQYAVSVIRRLWLNRDIKVLVVDDSLAHRTLMREVLTNQALFVLEANSAEEALGMLHEDDRIRMVFVDHVLPGMDGLQFVRKVRRTHKKDQLVILAVSSFQTKEITSRFLKLGANDSIGKPFSREELLCRVNLHLDTLDMLQTLKERAETDALTALSNRVHFLEQAERIRDDFQRGRSAEFSLAMIDVDHFKEINDSHGHATGDEVLVHLGRLFTNNTKGKDIVCRYGGEEFVILLRDTDFVSASAFFEDLRATVEGQPVPTRAGELAVTISIGYVHAPQHSVERMIQLADQAMYDAKQSGRNAVRSATDR